MFSYINVISAALLFVSILLRPTIATFNCGEGLWCHAFTPESGITLQTLAVDTGTSGYIALGGSSTNAKALSGNSLNAAAIVLLY